MLPVGNLVYKVNNCDVLSGLTRIRLQAVHGLHMYKNLQHVQHVQELTTCTTAIVDKNENVMIQLSVPIFQPIISNWISHLSIIIFSIVNRKRSHRVETSRIFVSFDNQQLSLILIHNRGQTKT